MGRALAVLAVVLLVVGGVLATVARPARTTTATTTPATAAGAGSAPVLVVTPGLLASRSGPVVVSARGPGRVLVAVGTATDVAAWAQGAATTTATRLEGDDGIATVSAAGEEQVPDPAGSDLWVRQAAGTHRASLTVAPAGGAAAVLVASDGTSPAPTALALTWTHHPVPFAAWGLLGAGTLLLGLLLGRRRAHRRAPRRTPPEGAPAVIDLREAPPPSADPPLVRPRGRRRSRR